MKKIGFYLFCGIFVILVLAPPTSARTRHKRHVHPLAKAEKTPVKPTDSSKSDSIAFASTQTILPIYSDPELPKRDGSLFQMIHYYYHRSGILFKIILFLNVFFLASAVVLSIGIFFKRLRSDYMNAQKKRCIDKYHQFITEWIYDDHGKIIPPDLLEELKNPINRNVFTAELLSLRDLLSGESAEKLKELFYLAGLQKDSVQKIHQRLWHIKAKGLQEVAEMNIPGGNELISNYLNSQNDLLRIESQVAWIRLNPDDPLSFYDDPNIQLTEWGFINALFALKKTGRVPDFSRLLNSSKRSTVIFALKMTGIFKQSNNQGIVGLKINDVDPEIRKEAIIAYRKIGLADPEINLPALYAGESFESNKSEILQALLLFNDSQNTIFFEQIMLHSNNLTHRILAAKGYIALCKTSPEKLDALYLFADPMLKKIINHAKDQRI